MRGSYGMWYQGCRLPALDRQICRYLALHDEEMVVNIVDRHLIGKSTGVRLDLTELWR